MFITTLFINSVVSWSPKMVTTFYTHCKFLRKHLSNNSLLATSWILFYEALKRIIFITTLFINSVVCWSPKMVTTFFSHRKVFRRHLSHISVLAISWILFYDALKRILLPTILFINSVVSSSPNLVRILSSLRKFFRWRLSDILLLETSWILFYEALKRIMFITTLFINSVVSWSPKMVTTFYTHCKFLRKHLSNNSLLATSWILFYEALKRIMFITTLFINSVVCWSPKMVTTFSSHRKVFRRHLSHISVLAISWILFYDALKRILLLTILFINSVVCWSAKMVTIFSSRRKFFCWHLSDNSLVATSWMCSKKLWSV